MKKCSIERGVHTLELYLGQLSYAEVDAMIEDLYDMAKKQKTPELIRQREKHPSPSNGPMRCTGYYPTGSFCKFINSSRSPVPFGSLSIPAPSPPGHIFQRRCTTQRSIPVCCRR